VDADQWSRVAEVFEAVLKEPTANRSRVLAELCHADDELRREVSRLLEADTASDQLIRPGGARGGTVDPDSDDFTSGTVVDSRYIITGTIGRGGMGIVYSASDRLSGETVALKRLHPKFAHRRHDNYETTTDSRSVLVSIAHEFRIAASIRHPNVVTVLDYGFDTVGRPYFTMVLCAGSQPINAASRTLDFASKIDLFIQLAEAVDFLHRRGLIHGDIKPGNVLVTGNNLKLVDFGIARYIGTSSTHFGTMPYTAPELLSGAPPSPKADLYSIGVLAREIFGGAGTLDAGAPHDLISVSLLGDMIDKLTHSDPELRYADASDLLTDLHACCGKPGPDPKSLADLVLTNSPDLVERRTQLDGLIRSLKELRAGKGCTWMITGEAGIGKTRLMDEFRIHALVNGCRVFRGGSSRTSGYPYHLWRVLLERAVLSGHLGAEQLEVLRTVIPGLENPSSGEETKDSNRQLRNVSPHQIFSCAQALLRTQDRPTVLILEDVQWADAESLDLLREAQSWTREFPFLLIATQRPPGVSVSEYTNVNKLTLPRFSKEGLEALLDAAIDPRLPDRPARLEKLQQSSGGNPLFAIEILRSLLRALHFEGASLTAEVDGPLPTIDQTISERLALLDPSLRSALQLAAAYGRQINLSVLERALEAGSLQPILYLAVENGILEYNEGQCRFVHDKYREALLTGISASNHKRLHARIATAIEQSDKGLSETPKLAFHWGQAANIEKERFYCSLAGTELLRLGAYQRAAVLLTRAQQLLYSIPDEAERLREELSISLNLGSAYLVIKGFASTEAKSAFEKAHRLSLETGKSTDVFEALFGQASSRLFRGELAMSKELARQCLALATEESNEHGIIQALFAIGNSLYWLGDFEGALRHYEDLVSRLEQMGEPRGFFGLGHNPRLTATTFGAWAAWAVGLPELALEIAKMAMRLAEETESPFCMAIAVHVLAIVRQHRSEVEETLVESERLVALSRGFPIYSAGGKILRGWALVRKGEVRTGAIELESAMRVWGELEAGLARTYFATLAAEALIRIGDSKRALQMIQRVISDMRHYDERSHEAELYRVRGLLFDLAGDARAAEADFLRAISVARRQKAISFELRAARDLARAWRSHGRSEHAHTILSAVLSQFKEGFSTVELREGRALLGPEEEKA